MTLRNLKGNKMITAVNTTAVLLLTWGFIGVGYAGEPGSFDDPLITQSYVDSKLTEINTTISGLKAKIDELTALKAELAPLKVQADEIVKIPKEIIEIKTRLDAVEKKNLNGADSVFEVIEVKKPQQIICGASTQIVLRSGTARVIASTAGGLSDLTGDLGRDLRAQDAVPINHLILIPRDDGRGIKITSTSAWVMIKGKYQIK